MAADATKAILSVAPVNIPVTVNVFILPASLSTSGSPVTVSISKSFSNIFISVLSPSHVHALNVIVKAPAFAFSNEGVTNFPILELEPSFTTPAAAYPFSADQPEFPKSNFPLAVDPLVPNSPSAAITLKSSLNITTSLAANWPKHKHAITIATAHFK